MAYSKHTNPDVARRLWILCRQIYQAHRSLIIYRALHSVVAASPKSTCADAFLAISDASVNNLIVMTHQLFDETKGAYSLFHANKDKALYKTKDDTARLGSLFTNYRESIKKIRQYRHDVAAHASRDKSAKTILEGLGLEIGEVEAILKAAAACVEELLLANPIFGMRIPDFDQSNENLEAQLKNVFAKGFA